MQTHNFAYCFIWAWHLYLTFREKHQLRVYKNRVLRNIFEPVGEAVTGDYRKLDNEKPCDL